MLALLIGDFMHNLRSALDHVVVASVPKQMRRNTTSFPISQVDIFAKDSNGEFVVKDDDARKNFDRTLKGIDPQARTRIVSAQPYKAGADAHLHVLGIISRIDNADKHRELTTFGAGLMNVRMEMAYHGVTRTATRNSLPVTGFLKDNAVVGIRDSDRDDRPVRPHQIPAEMQVEFGGTAVIFIHLRRLGGKKRQSSFKLRLTLLSALRDVRRVLRRLERYAIYK